MSKKPPVKTAKKKRIEKDITQEIIVPKTEEVQIREFPWTEKQKQLIDLICDRRNSIIFISGRAGTSKTLTSVYAALRLLKEKKTTGITYIRSIAESASKGLGSLPGDLAEKFSPFSGPLLDKLDELISPKEADALMESGIIKAIPINFLRGRQFRDVTIIDEAQSLDKNELVTVITRIAEGGKFIFCADPQQSDIGSKSGFMKFFELFNNEESRARGIQVFEFGAEDIKRSKILSFVCDKIETLK
jgi:predicted ribonuclease YlaK